MKNNLCLVVASLLPKIIIIVKQRILQGNAEIQNFSSRVSNVLQVSTLNKWSIFQHEKRNFRSSSGHAMFYCISTPMKYQTNHLDIFFCQERCDLLCNHSNSELFMCEDNMFFLHVKISFFCTKAHLLFHWSDMLIIDLNCCAHSFCLVFPVIYYET